MAVPRQSPALDRAVDVARRLKPGSWEGVEALSMLAVETAGSPIAEDFLRTAQSAADSLKSGTWGHVRALTWLARAHREVAAHRSG